MLKSPLLKRLVLHFECAIEDAVRDFAAACPAGARVLDAGAGEGRYRAAFAHCRYTGVDLGVGDARWNYRGLDAVCDLAALPFADAAFDAAIQIVTLEHLADPAAALREMARAMRPGAPLLLVAPFEWEVHQAPHDYFRYTRYGLDRLLRGAGFEVREIRAVGGFGRLLSRRLMNGVRLSMRGWGWVAFPLLALLFGPLALAAPLLDGLDPRRTFTLGYLCRGRRIISMQSIRIR